MPSLAEQIELACLLEATARKPGNVHPGAAFNDLHYHDFVRAAEVSAPILASSHRRGIGRSVFDAVQATRAATGTNVNLGMCLLLAPLAAGVANGGLWEQARAALAASTVEDTEWIYRAIRLAQPGGLGTSSEQDVSQPPSVTIPAVMALAADRDDVARELATGCQRLECQIVPQLMARLESPEPWRAALANNRAGTERSPPPSCGSQAILRWEQAIIVTYVHLIGEGDTLICRKCGTTMMREAADRAAAVLDQLSRSGSFEFSTLRDFDDWLRADGHRRNPGTSADLMAAAIFAVLHSSPLPVPNRNELLAHAARIAGSAR